MTFFENHLKKVIKVCQTAYTYCKSLTVACGMMDGVWGFGFFFAVFTIFVFSIFQNLTIF